MSSYAGKNTHQKHDDTSRFERRVRADLRQRRWLRVHVMLIGTLTFLACWGISSALLHVGVSSLPMRHAGALLGAYGVYLLLLWMWSHYLLNRDDGTLDLFDGLNAIDLGPSGESRAAASPTFRSGGGGDFGGGGATSEWSDDVVSSSSKGVFDSAGDAVSGTMEGLGSADEGAVIAIPLIVIVGVAALLAAALGFAVVGLFGIEVLVGVAVEIAFASAGGAIALKARREGWMTHAIKRTAGPMAAVLVASVLASMTVAHWLPDVKTLPDAIRLISSAI